MHLAGNSSKLVNKTAGRDVLAVLKVTSPRVPHSNSIGAKYNPALRDLPQFCPGGDRWKWEGG